MSKLYAKIRERWIVNQEFENQISKILNKYELVRIRDSYCGNGRTFYLEYDEKLNAYVLKFYLLSEKQFYNAFNEIKEYIKSIGYSFKNRIYKNCLELTIYS